MQSLGMSSGATAAYYFSSRFQNVPSIFMAEPDHFVTLDGRIAVTLHMQNIGAMRKRSMLLKDCVDRTLPIRFLHCSLDR